MPTPTPTWEFNNTDLHNIYDAIVAGGGGGGNLAGDLLNGTLEPENFFGFYPTTFAGILTNTSATYSSANDLYNLMSGLSEPGNIGGFYPDRINDIKLDLDLLASLFDGGATPYNLGGFYPDTIFKIKENTSNTEAAVKGIAQFGLTSGKTILARGVDGFADSAAAATACATWMNSQNGNFFAISITISHISGVNGHSYAVLYRTLI